MTALYPEIEPYEQGFLEVDNGHSIYWETCGSPHGKPAVFLHGGPGSGCTPGSRRLFDPAAYRLVLFDQRNGGRSRPHADDLDTDLTHNTTQHLIADMEQLRRRLNIDRWLLYGISWGCTLALAYAETHPERVSEIILAGVTTGRHCEVEWLFRGGAALFFPEQWERLRSFLPEAERGGDVPSAYYRRLNAPDLAERQKAADSWCLWESATVDWPPSTQLVGRFNDPVFARAFARIVTHYVRHDLFLEDQVLIRHADALADIPGILINGRYDFQAPIGNAWELKRVWPRAELVIIDNSGHAPNDDMRRALLEATQRFAR
jgi:proline iminopeptidase